MTVSAYTLIVTDNQGIPPYLHGMHKNDNMIKTSGFDMKIFVLNNSPISQKLPIL